MLPGCVVKNIYQEYRLCLKRKRKRTLTMSERSESKRIGAKQHKNSGRNNQKGDATWQNFTVDFKEVKKSFTLNKDVWAKITTDAIKNHKDPALIVSIGEENSKVRLAIVELSILEDLVNTKNTTPQSRPIDQGSGII
jgi:outer membrane phospholipase A